MELIHKLDLRLVTYSTGKSHNIRFGIFECPVCNKHVEKAIKDGKNAKTCGSLDCNPNKKHGLFGTKLYHVWGTLKQRCTNPNNPKYYRYGGRGIKLDPKWETFEGFAEDMAPTYKEGLTIDRKDNDGDYCKDNCHWLSGSVNSSKDKVKTLVKYNLEGKFIASYNSAKEACKVNEGITPQSLSRVTKNNKPYKGFRWSYTESESDLSDEELKQSEYSARKSKAVVKLCINTGEILEEFSSVTKAAKSVKCSATAISNMLSGNSKSAGGFIWKYN